MIQIYKTTVTYCKIFDKPAKIDGKSMKIDEERTLKNAKKSVSEIYTRKKGEFKAFIQQKNCVSLWRNFDAEIGKIRKTSSDKIEKREYCD